MRLLSIRSARVKLILLSIMHFATDGLCSYLALSMLYPNNPELSFYVFIGYNLLAFVTQSPIGALIDKYNRPRLFLAVSIACMIIGYLCAPICLLSVLFIGISNSIFHVAGGKFVTDKSGNDISHLGIFVSTGAVGLMLGQVYSNLTFLPYVFFTLLTVCGLMMIFSEQTETVSYPEEYVNPDGESTALLMVLAVVLIRSFVGKVASPDFTLDSGLLLIISIATALGKAMGGICSKYIGIRPTTYVSMAISAICLTVGAGNELVFIFGIFAFNFSMPITLYLANILSKSKEGFAFGTLAAVLVPGYFLAMLFTYSTVMRILAAILCLVSIVVISIISKRVHRYDRACDTDSNN